MPNTVPFVRCVINERGLFRATVVVDGRSRWVREDANAYKLAERLRMCCPNIDHVECEDGVLDTGELTLAECLEAVAYRSVH